MSISARHSAARREPKPAEPRSPGKRPPGGKWKFALAGLAGVFVLLACYDLISLSGQPGPDGIGPAPGASTPSNGAGRTSSAASAPAASGSASGAASQSPGAYRQLPVASLAAFGPEGTADGDNPAGVSKISDVGTDQPWYTQWYATAQFGGLKAGTGLLLDMGKAVTVRDVRLTLGSSPGADVEVRVGNSPSPGLPTVASARDAGGDVQLTAASPATGRYVLVWFTRLPADGKGHYQVDVYDLSVDGAAGNGN